MRDPIHHVQGKLEIKIVRVFGMQHAAVGTFPPNFEQQLYVKTFLEHQMAYISASQTKVREDIIRKLHQILITATFTNNGHRSSTLADQVRDVGEIMLKISTTVVASRGHNRFRCLQSLHYLQR